MHFPEFLKYYHLETYLFEEVSPRYQNTHALCAFDFFCIVIWKANRAKSRIAKRLLRKHESLQDAIDALCINLWEAQNSKERLRWLIAVWGFRLPMASAILAVLFPNDFTIYDVRVCDVLGTFHDAQFTHDFDKLWTRYCEYIRCVREAVTGVDSLRDKDRSLWGKSFAQQLLSDIDSSFGVQADEDDMT